MDYSVLEHLGELRGRLLKVLGVLLLLTIGSFVGAEWMLAMLLKPSPLGEHALTSLDPAGVFVQSLRLSLTCGVVLSLPLIFYQGWKFVSPGLQVREQKVLLWTLFGGTFLFLVGLLFAYFYVVPTALHFFWEYSRHFGITPGWTIDYYLNFVMMLLLAFGVAFEFPLVILLLAHFSIVSPKTLSAKRPFIIVGIAIAAAFLTPPDVVSQLLLGIPLWVLFEISVFFAKRL